MAGLFEAAVGNPALTVEIIDVLQQSAADTGVPLSGPLQFVKTASLSTTFQFAAANGLRELAARHHLTFEAESPARDAARQMAAAVRLAKANPTSTSVGETFMLLFLAAALMFAPNSFAGVRVPAPVASSRKAS